MSSLCSSLYLQNYEHLFKVNDKSVGGSFYLQSKVSILFLSIFKFSTLNEPLCEFVHLNVFSYIIVVIGCLQVVRAKERLDEELSIQTQDKQQSHQKTET